MKNTPTHIGRIDQYFFEIFKKFKNKNCTNTYRPYQPLSVDTSRYSAKSVFIVMAFANTGDLLADMICVYFEP